MTDRPILFSAPMVRALLAGTKTQTRRIIKPRGGASLFSGQWADEYVLDPGNSEWREAAYPWRVGDHLWVKETWRTGGQFDHLAPRALIQEHAEPIAYCADEPPGKILRTGKARPSIFMVRWASRLTLHVSDVRVQRLQSISEDDAIAEGMTQETADAIMSPDELAMFASTHILCPEARGRILYETIWGQINGPGSWEANPWVVAITFTKAEPSHV